MSGGDYGLPAAETAEKSSSAMLTGPIILDADDLGQITKRKVRHRPDGREQKIAFLGFR
jgi:hypothetical protein